MGSDITYYAPDVGGNCVSTSELKASEVTISDKAE